MPGQEPLIPKHGGYRKLKSFQIGQLIYDVTVRFCDCYIGRRSRMYDQMTQAARSGVQNVAEGSRASGTSKKTELKLTNVARASLEELRLDYEDFLRQRGLEAWKPDHPALRRFKARRCATLEEVREWVEEERRRSAAGQAHGPTQDQHRPAQNQHRPTQTEANAGADSKGAAPNEAPSVLVGGGPCQSVSSSVLVANAALSLLNLCCHLLNRQLAAQAEAFVSEGGFTERLYRTRTARRRNERDDDQRG